jgi:recombination protein RecA
MKDIREVMSKLQKKYGKDVIKLGGMAEIQKVPTDIISLDRLLQGGFPRGRWTMVFGQKATCKTSLCKYFVGKMQAAGEQILVVDAENTWDPDYGKELGMDASKCYYNRPNTVEEMGTIINDVAPHVGLIVVDSITSVSASQELERDLEQDTMALIPRKLSQFFRMTNPVVGKSNCVVLLVNQVRVNMQGNYAFDDFPGGNALAHYCSCILHTGRGKKADNPQKEVDGKKVDAGFTVNIKMEKTKMSATEGQKATLNYYYDSPHFDPVDDLFKIALIDEVVERKGAYYSYEGYSEQGKDAFIQLMRTNKKLFEEIKKEILK